MDIYKLLREGMSAEELVEQFATALENAQLRIEKEDKEAAAKAAEEAWIKVRQEEAREALGAALIDFALAYDIIDEVDEEYLSAIDKYITFLASPADVKTATGAKRPKFNGKVIIYG